MSRKISDLRNNLTGKPFGDQRKSRAQEKLGKTTKPSRYFTTEIPSNESPDGFTGIHEIHTWPCFNKQK